MGKHYSLTVVFSTVLRLVQRQAGWMKLVLFPPGPIAVPSYQPKHVSDIHSFGILQHLHWLPVEQRIKFKLAMLTHNILSSSQPAYLRSLLSHHTPTRSLRSANTNLLSVPRVRTTFASRGFSVAAPTVWNSLPPTIRNSSSTYTFRRLLKTHYFQQAFSSP